MGCCCCGSDDNSEEQKQIQKEKYETSGGGFILNQTRCITDLPMLLVFIAFIVGLCYVAGLAWTDGDYFRILYGTNWKGDACGRGANSDFKRQYWPNVLFYKELGSVCLDSCPDSQGTTSDIIWGDSTFSFTDTYSYQVICTCNPDIAEGNPNCGVRGNGACGGNTQVTASQTGGTTWVASNVLGGLCSATDATDRGYYKATLTYTAASSTTDDAANYWMKYTPQYTNDMCYLQSKVGGTACTNGGTHVNTLNSQEYKMNVPMCNVMYRTKDIFNRCVPWLSYNTMASLFCYSTSDCPEDKLTDEFDSVSAFFEEVSATHENKRLIATPGIC